MQITENLNGHQTLHTDVAQAPIANKAVLAIFHQNLAARLEALVFDTKELLYQYSHTEANPQDFARQLQLIAETAQQLGTDTEVWEFLRQA